MPGIFDTSCYGVDIDNYHLNSLLYADNVILLSTTETGLQICIIMKSIATTGVSKFIMINQKL